MLIVNDTRIRELNRLYREIDSPTDVLAFAMAEGEFAQLNSEVLGDIVISAETAETQAKRAGHGLAEELQLLAVHGTLHLVGHEDESETGRACMRRLERKYLKRLRKRGGEGP